MGFLGVGWIGLNRMDAILASGHVEGVAVCDPSAEMRAQALSRLPEATVCETLDDMVRVAPDGIVIATPSALHSAQAIHCLGAGIAVFCQKPLGRNASETQAVVEAARRADRLLAVDFSYRFIEASVAIATLVRRGELGRIFAIDLTFHNAYGPDKAWFYDPQQSGGGCLVDLGIHLIDLAAWIMGPAWAVEEVSASLFSGGRRFEKGAASEDCARAAITLRGGASVRLACSWRLNAGQDAIIEASFFGTKGGAALKNVGGSFYDFVAELYRGTSREILHQPPDAWSGRAAVDWSRRLAENKRYVEEEVGPTQVARVLDAIYDDHIRRSTTAAG